MRMLLLLPTLWLLGGCAAQSSSLQLSQAVPASPPRPVLLVPGMMGAAQNFDAMKARLERSGWSAVRAITLEPNDGSLSVPEMALQVGRAAQALRAETGVDQIDIVGFSMGALVTRFWMQRLGGREQVRRFISISGPHAGTLTAFLRPGAGVRQMRPRSRLLRALAADPRPWGDVEVHTFRTPLDLIIVPSSSSLLPGAATERTFLVPIHHWMLSDAQVIEAVIEVLGAPESPP
jgi:triacylglycerol lipase